MSRRTLCPVDGPRAFTPKTVRLDGSTMSDIRLADGTWALYDGPATAKGIDSVLWRETGGFVAGVKEVMVAVTEISREIWKGVL